jgi:hypothetical protein
LNYITLHYITTEARRMGSFKSVSLYLIIGRQCSISRHLIIGVHLKAAIFRDMLEISELFSLWKSNKTYKIGWNNFAKTLYIRNTIFELLLNTELAIYVLLKSSLKGIQVYYMVLFVCLLKWYLYKSCRCTTPSRYDCIYGIRDIIL